MYKDTFQFRNKFKILKNAYRPTLFFFLAMKPEHNRSLFLDLSKKHHGHPPLYQNKHLATLNSYLEVKYWLRITPLA